VPVYVHEDDVPLTKHPRRYGHERARSYYVTLDPYRNSRGPQIVSRAATADSERALHSLDALAATGATTVLTGHREPWREGVEAAVARAREAGVS
jgi:hypothetical protein